MNADDIFRRLRGAVGNAMAWGAAWFTLGLAAFAVMKVAGIVPASVSWLDALAMSVKFAVIGGIAGGAFSLFIGLLYRGRRLADISAVRFGLGGGIVAGLFVPAFLQAMNLLSGDGFVPMGLVLDDALWSALFGGVAAGASLRLAQRAEPLLPGGGQDRLGRSGSPDRLAAADERPVSIPQRSRPVQS